jgi:hypothetical protein
MARNIRRTFASRPFFWLESEARAADDTPYYPFRTPA